MIKLDTKRKRKVLEIVCKKCALSWCVFPDEFSNINNIRLDCPFNNCDGEGKFGRNDLVMYDD